VTVTVKLALLIVNSYGQAAPGAKWFVVGSQWHDIHTLYLLVQRTHNLHHMGIGDSTPHVMELHVKFKLCC
jgi:hypothetical protein